MQETLYVFRLGEKGGFVITTDRQGSRLPLDDALGYKPGDWKFLDAIPSSELPKMITNAREVEPALTSHGYYSITAIATSSPDTRFSQSIVLRSCADGHLRLKGIWAEWMWEARREVMVDTVQVHSKKTTVLDYSPCNLVANPASRPSVSAN
jgi:hypothetical protein